MITVFRLTKYANGYPSGWTKSFEKKFNNLAEAQAYARRQADLLINYEGFTLDEIQESPILDEIQRETFTAFFSHECSTEVKLCIRGYQECLS